MDNIKTVDVNRYEDIPEELKQGGIKIGTIGERGDPLYWPNDEMATMHKVIVGKQASGKQSYLANFAVDAIKKGDSVILIDTEDGNKLSNDIRDYMPKECEERIIVMDLSNSEHFIPLNINLRRETLEERLITANYRTNHIEYILDLYGTSQIWERRYLRNICKIVFSVEGTTLKDVLDSLLSKSKMEEFIDRSGLRDTGLTEYMQLPEPDKLEGLIEKIGQLVNGHRMEMITSKETSRIDFNYLADNRYCVIIKIPESKFSRNKLNTLVTTLYHKIWVESVTGYRGVAPSNITHIIIDKIHKFPQIVDIMKLNCRESTMYKISFVITSETLYQLGGLTSHMKSSGANFMVFSNNLEDFESLGSMIRDSGYNVEECKGLKKYYTVNLVNYKRDYTTTITKLEEPLGIKFKRYDRSYLDQKSIKKYGVEYI